MSEPITSALLASLGFLVIECLAEDSFQLIVYPSWFADFCGETFSLNTDFNLTQTFPFIEVFLFDAQSFWQSNKSGQLKSGPWTETSNLNGKDYHLEAIALSVNQRRLLVIENISVSFDEKQLLLQRLREGTLNNDKIIKKMRAELIAKQISQENTALLGQVLNDRYKIDLILGKGGLGIVYRALDLQTNKIVAVKMLLETSDDLDYSQKLFEREVKILTRIQHPNVVGILDSGITETGKLYFVMDYVEGKNLSSLSEEERIWSIERTFNLLKHVCAGLYAIHQENIIHRDLKPANIMVKSENGQEVAIILDLGIAKIVADPKGNTLMKLTSTGIIVGTLQYLSPEQCLGKPLDARSDIYSLGIIIYELLSGMLPYESDTVEGWLYEHLRTVPEPLNNINPMISKEISEVVLMALEKNKDNRPKTMLEFFEEFARAVGGK